MTLREDIHKGLPGETRVSVNLVVGSDPDDLELVAAQPGKRIAVLAYRLVPSTIMNLQFQSATTALTGEMISNNTVPPQADFSPVPYVETAVGEALNLHTSGALGTVRGWLLCVVRD